MTILPLLAYAALAVIAFGLVNLVKPMRRLGVAHRLRGGQIAVLGVVALLALAAVAPGGDDATDGEAPSAVPVPSAEEISADAEAAARARAELDAQALCDGEFRGRARYPETVDYPLVDEYAAVEHSDDGVLVQAGPRADNAFGVSQRYVYRCLVANGTLTTFVVQELQ